MIQPPNLQTELLACSRATRAWVLALSASHGELVEACRTAYEHAIADPMARLDQPQLRKLAAALAAVGETTTIIHSIPQRPGAREEYEARVKAGPPHRPEMTWKPDAAGEKGT